jgi:FtsH-binding integral membrane protein
MAENHHIIPVWFFVGVILLIYGVLIFVTGVAEFENPPHTVLAELHAPVWWGAILTVIGALFVYLFRPKKPAKTA